MERLTPVVVDYKMVTALGSETDTCWESLLQNKTGIKKVQRFDTGHLQSPFGATVDDLNFGSSKSTVMQMLEKILKDKSGAKEDFLILATTTGEIDFLEKDILKKDSDYRESSLDNLLEKAKKITGIESASLVSAACSSSNAALAHAASLISGGGKSSVLVLACDSISEFVFSGFSSLMALDKNKARPFDKNREGLTVGEGAGFMVLKSREKAEQEKQEILAELIGWGISNDANHMTGPSRAGEGLAFAIEDAINCAGINKQQIGSICAHGTGTLYNDSMEIKAFKKAFDQSLPVYSVKGALGHTMGVSGLIEAIITIKSLSEKKTPPTVGLNNVDSEAEAWVNNKAQHIDKNISLSVNSGFGGINAAVLLQK